jgi:hypothetical protein
MRAGSGKATRRLVLVPAFVWLALPGCGTTDGQRDAAGFVEVFPFVRVDRSRGMVEFDGVVPIDCHDPHTPIVYLEVVACTPDTKEHEALVLTRARASHVHAALLLAGFVPGSPGSWRWDGRQVEGVPPEGDPVEVRFVLRDAAGGEAAVSPADWVVSAPSGRRLAEAGGTWVFAGSRFVEIGGQIHYDADGSGALIGLATFGGEVVAWSEVFSPESAVQEPEWIADPGRVPRAGTAVIVRLSRPGLGR